MTTDGPLSGEVKRGGEEFTLDTSGEATRKRYRGYDIRPTDPVPPIPCWRDFAWSFVHKDYDGPEDNRCGHAASAEACKAEIDEREFDACRCSAADPSECMALVCEHREAAGGAS